MEEIDLKKEKEEHKKKYPNKDKKSLVVKWAM